MSSPLFEQVVAASGLSAIFARSSVKRVLERGGVDPASFRRADLQRLMPEFERLLKGFLEDQAPAALARLQALARGESVS